MSVHHHGAVGKIRWGRRQQPNRSQGCGQFSWTYLRCWSNLSSQKFRFPLTNWVSEFPQESGQKLFSSLTPNPRAHCSCDSWDSNREWKGVSLLFLFQLCYHREKKLSWARRNHGMHFKAFPCAHSTLALSQPVQEAPKSPNAKRNHLQGCEKSYLEIFFPLLAHQ